MASGKALTGESLIAALALPDTAPNPILKELMTSKDALYELGMKAEDDLLRAEYMAAYNRVIYAIERVMCAKNRIAELAGER